VPLILACLPLILLITALLAVTQGPRNVFYAGERLGKDRKPFRILKFKTLRDEASLLTAGQVLPSGSQLETPIGKHLRDTRLDELPQLFNVLIGDMNMFGPRPVRPSIAAKCRATIPGYDARFQVKPGLIGYTQALIPHGTDKAIRARINARICRSESDLVQELLFIAVTGLSVFAWTLRVALRAATNWRLPSSWRDSVRVHGLAHVAVPGGVLAYRLLRADGEKLLIEGTEPLPHGAQQHSVSLCGRRRLRPLAKSARCTAIALASETWIHGAATPIFRYTMRYSPESAFHRYLVDRYVLGRVVVR
jgi:lipopolysaccharide/colanic/teichoic acid biosynthesis glycosyltransferase